MQRNQPSRRRKSGTLTGRERQRQRRAESGTLAESDAPSSLSDLCDKIPYLPEEACNCQSISGYLDLIGKDPCEYGPYQSFCPQAYAEMVEVGRCEGNGGPKTGGPGYQKAGMSTPVKLALGAAAGGTVLALIMNE
jgi:hypothetical protein